MTTRNIVPRETGQGNIGTFLKKWLKGWFGSIFLGSTGIVDSNENEVLKPESVASAINEITIKNAALGNGPEVKATGDDGDIDINLVPKGTGKINVDGPADVNGNLTIAAGSSLQKALSGDLVLECFPATAGTSAATLNAAGAGTFTKTITINLKDAAGNLHKWASLALPSTIEDTIADENVFPPTRSDETPDLASGTVDIVLTYDTDAGVTKTYVAGETITFTVKAPTDGILGYPVADATFVDTLIE